MEYKLIIIGYIIKIKMNITTAVMTAMSLSMLTKPILATTPTTQQSNNNKAFNDMATVIIQVPISIFKKSTHDKIILRDQFAKILRPLLKRGQRTRSGFSGARGLFITVN